MKNKNSFLPYTMYKDQFRVDGSYRNVEIKSLNLLEGQEAMILMTLRQANISCTRHKKLTIKTKLYNLNNRVKASQKLGKDI